MRLIVRTFIAAVAAAMLLLAATRMGIIDLPRRYDPFAVPDLKDQPGPFLSTQLKLLDIDVQNCTAALRRAGINATISPNASRAANCALTDTLHLTKLSQSKLTEVQTRCNIAARLYMWERHVLQPAALRLLGQPIAEILHFGSFSCRTIAGRSTMSEHATANAFDIAGFKLRNGKTISILKDWPTNSPEAKFLRLARDGACDYFNLTLSPEYNKAHADHFHVDMGWLRRCN